MNIYYKLDKDNNVVPCSAAEGENLFRDINLRRIKLTKIGDKEVSTVFLVIDHLGGIFETMIFSEGDRGQPRNFENFQQRYHTYEGALEGHNKVCEMLKNSMD